MSLPLFFVALGTLFKHGFHTPPALRKNRQSAVAIACDITLPAFGDELKGEIEVMFCEPVVVRVALRA